MQIRNDVKKLVHVGNRYAIDNTADTELF